MTGKQQRHTAAGVAGLVAAICAILNAGGGTFDPAAATAPLLAGIAPTGIAAIQRPASLSYRSGLRPDIKSLVVTGMPQVPAAARLDEDAGGPKVNESDDEASSRKLAPEDDFGGRDDVRTGASFGPLGQALSGTPRAADGGGSQASLPIERAKAPAPLLAAAHVHGVAQGLGQRVSALAPRATPQNRLSPGTASSTAIAPAASNAATQGAPAALIAAPTTGDGSPKTAAAGTDATTNSSGSGISAMSGGGSGGAATLGLASSAASLKTASTKTKRSGKLSAWVMKNAWKLYYVIRRTGGYKFDGYNDCYGFVKRTWNPILGFLKKHKVKGDYPSVLPVGDFPSSKWQPIRDWNMLIVGDVLGTVQGHRGGADVDYGMYGGKKGKVHYQFSNGSNPGPRLKPQTGRYRYYYVPTHELLKRLNK